MSFRISTLGSKSNFNISCSSRIQSTKLHLLTHAHAHKHTHQSSLQSSGSFGSNCGEVMIRVNQDNLKRCGSSGTFWITWTVPFLNPECLDLVDATGELRGQDRVDGTCQSRSGTEQRAPSLLYGPERWSGGVKAESLGERRNLTPCSSTFTCRL